MALWQDSLPLEGDLKSSNATLTLVHPDNPNGTAIVICPEGGYRNLVTGPEGTGIARWLSSLPRLDWLESFLRKVP